jgi:putative oxidoreductase
MADIGLLIVRAIIGLLFIGHGLQKLTGWFGGHGLAGTGQFMEGIGLRPGRTWAAFAGAAEVLGGLLFALGWLNPLGSVLICAVMFMAIARVHWARGLWVSNGGSEYPLVNVAAAIGLALVGPGGYSLDAYLGSRLPVGPVLGYGLAAALLVVALTWAADARRTRVQARTA